MSVGRRVIDRNSEGAKVSPSLASIPPNARGIPRYQRGEYPQRGEENPDISEVTAGGINSLLRLVSRQLTSPQPPPLAGQFVFERDGVSQLRTRPSDTKFLVIHKEYSSVSIFSYRECFPRERSHLMFQYIIDTVEFD